MINCPCSSQKNFNECCEPFITYTKIPSSPESLMRSRYTAYSQGNIDYVAKTMRGKPLVNFDTQQVKQWADSVKWLGLKIISTQTEKDRGFVTFVAEYEKDGKKHYLQEKSEFHLHHNTWYYVDGQETLSRNDPCPCGSGKKYKKCCL